MDNRTYFVNRVAPTEAPALNALWDDDAWKAAETVKLNWAWPGYDAPLPIVEARLLHDGRTIHGIYRVQDHSILARATKLNDSVCRDSCVEFFFRPFADKGYLNLEMSASGAHLCYFIRDYHRTGDGYRDYEPLPPEICGLLPTLGTTGVVPEEREGDLTWQMRFQVPMTVPEHYLGSIGDLSGQRWTGNFYKCGDRLKHPHWMGWQSVPELNFHLPDSFGILEFR